VTTRRVIAIALFLVAATFLAATIAPLAAAVVIALWGAAVAVYPWGSAE
jgi:hypothetical protein